MSWELNVSRYDNHTQFYMFEEMFKNAAIIYFCLFKNMFKKFF